MHQGSCLCGTIRFRITGDLPGPDACHCVSCRKVSGHHGASTDVKKAAMTIEGEDALTWYASSEKVRRGFCSRCGANLFFDPPALDWIGVSMGAFDTPTETNLAVHIFVSQKGDYYQITDGLPQNDR